MKLNGYPLELIQPEILRVKVFEPIMLLGKDRFKDVDIRIRVRGGGHTSQIYGFAILFGVDVTFSVAIRQAISKSIVAYYQKFVDEASKQEIKEIIVAHDRTLLVADPRRMEPKKFGGPSARTRYQKSVLSVSAHSSSLSTVNHFRMAVRIFFINLMKLHCIRFHLMCFHD